MQKPEKQQQLFHHVLILLIVLLAPLLSFGQNKRSLDTLAIYEKAKRVPAKWAKDPETLAKYLSKDYQEEGAKVLAITYWIAQNIKYNYKAFKERAILQNSTQKVLQMKKALCGEYARLFQEMCAAVNIEAEIVRGYTQGFDFFETDTLYRDEHAWSIVKIDNEWKLLDLTYGSGHVQRKKQGFKKFMARTFGAKYSPKFKYVHKFNPRWFFVKPDEMIFTHFPNLNQYQLLKVPLPHKLYKQGGWLIYGHLSWYYKTLKQSEKIEAYLQLSEEERWILEAEEGFKNNPSNHRVKGVNYYWVLNHMYEKTLGKAAKDVEMPIWNRMDSFAQIVDSFLRLSILDNHKEFEQKQAQSQTWQKYLHHQNSKHIKKLKTRKKINQKQERLIQKIAQTNTSGQSFVTQNAHRYKGSAILNTARPINEEQEDGELSLRLIGQIDSLKTISQLALTQKDSFIQYYIDGSRGYYVNNREQLILKIHRANAYALKQQFKEKRLELELIYEDQSLLDKTWFRNSQQRADSINKVVTDTFLKALYVDQLSMQNLMKTYFVTIGDQLKKIRQVKSKSIQNLREDSRYLAAIEAIETQFELYKVELKSCIAFQKQLTRSLAQEIKYLQASEKTLKQDNELENFRHVEYMHYRNAIKNAENTRMSFVLQKVAKIKSYIEAAKQEIRNN